MSQSESASRETDQQSVETARAHESDGSIRATIPSDLADAVGVSDGETLLWTYSDDENELRVRPASEVEWELSFKRRPPSP